MNREQLIESAKGLIQISEESLNEYTQKREGLVAALNQRMEQREDAAMLVGERNLNMMKDNHHNHSRFIESMLRQFEPEVLVDTVLWVYRAYRSHGFNLTYWPAQLNGWIEVMKPALSCQAQQEILPLYEWMILHQPDFVALSDPALQPATGQSAH